MRRNKPWIDDTWHDPNSEGPPMSELTRGDNFVVVHTNPLRIEWYEVGNVVTDEVGDWVQWLGLSDDSRYEVSGGCGDA